MSKKNELNTRQRAFAELFSKTGNATQSAIGAGYSKKSAEAQACALLKNPRVAEYIESLATKQTNKRIASAEVRQEWLTDIILGRVHDWRTNADDEEVRTHARLPVRIKAAELLARMRGELIDKTQLTGRVTVTRIEKRFDGVKPAIEGECRNEDDEK